jgi:hypothetical protein
MFAPNPWLESFKGAGVARAAEPEFTSEFRLQDCKFKAKGANPHFILQPGYQLVLEGEDDGEAVRLVITVLKKTEKVSVPGIGVVKTAVVEERESKDGDLVEVSRNFFAICEKTNDVFYFGEEVNICEDGLEPNGDGFTCNGGEPDHSGAWRAGVDGAVPGIIMPGTFLLGSRYFQELAPNAMDRAEHVEMGLTVDTLAGTFEKCVRVVETTPLEPGESEKIYCPGIGLVVDDVLVLVEFGRNIADLDEE